ncbi:MAG TPA: fumarylacetoacetate hydrolase family protein [Solirubrobacterales bacterium]|jgi:2-keto-4-pentenoate hydratase|nr:fumarylacetoacetate hydrolase family protein [Solirubrobacterales bacterium]
MNRPPFGLGSAAAGEAAALLWECWGAARRIDALPDRCRPAGVDDGWAIQRALDGHAGPAVGWKIAATSPAGQAHIGADGPLCGRVYKRMVVPPGSELDAAVLAMGMGSAEAEFAFRLGTDLDAAGAPVDRQRAIAAVASLHPAIEVPGSRFTDFSAVGVPSLVADAMCGAHVVVGEAARGWDPERLPVHPVEMLRNGEPVAAGSGANVLGDPCLALAWLANELGRRGEMLRTGDLVITGACTSPNAITAGDALRADFGALGAVEIAFPTAG